MTLHFDPAEHATRQSRAHAAMKDAGLDALLMFAPESHNWICGYDTFGFAMFQCLVLTRDGDLHLLTRMPDLRQAQQTSTLPHDHIHIWTERFDSDPAQDLARLLADLGVSGRIGFENATVGLTDANGQTLRAALPDLIPAPHLIRGLRQDKSAAEVAMHRKAAALSDDALDAGLSLTRAGAFEGDILAAMQGAVFKGGGDYAGNEFIIGSGEHALLCRYYSGRRHLDPSDQLTLEWSGAYARYHAAMMRTVVIGEPSDTHKRMHDACAEALAACEDAIKPGQPMGDVYAAHAAVFDRHGFADARLQACGYGMGAIYNPIWVDFPMFTEGNPTLMRENQVFFLHMILMDSATGAAMTLGHSVLVTADGAARLSRHDTALLCR
ncbi:Xaa-Pro dipeptidase [Cognatiyoonia koreensis]|uniref:Xaa-Pro dipeptidase n=1 Tax=Cognatiyoonia koreensis TaxID=364200 RepID=A0A1I0NWX4_9RHOB|nr:Xaa-Pro peptidase family protein [Cognatiyoonia koreensis]SEW05543.1 Xaa-Pro dipeptidase [Cognatiyoonia koreensis]